MNVVAIDTAGPVIGVALSCAGSVTLRSQRTRRGSEQLLLPWVEALLAEAGLARSQVDGFGVSRGPGAFTGLRVGLATVVGLALALDRPVWSTDSLTPRGIATGLDAVLVMLDARKSRVYAGVVSGGALAADIVDEAPQAVLSKQQAPFWATGEGAIVYRALVEEHGGQVTEEAEHPAVDTLATLAASAMERGEGQSALDLEPFYLRAPDAVVPRSMRNE